MTTKRMRAALLSLAMLAGLGLGLATATNSEGWTAAGLHRTCTSVTAHNPEAQTATVRAEVGPFTVGDTIPPGGDLTKQFGPTGTVSVTVNYPGDATLRTSTAGPVAGCPPPPTQPPPTVPPTTVKPPSTTTTAPHGTTTTAPPAGPSAPQAPASPPAAVPTPATPAFTG